MEAPNDATTLRLVEGWPLAFDSDEPRIRDLDLAERLGYDVEVTAAISRGSRHPRGPNGPRCPCPVVKHRRLHAPPCRKASPVATLAPAGAA